jgi:small conductance mechanosensitive channel
VVDTGLLEEIERSRFIEDWREYFVARPLTIVSLVILGLVMRWLAHRIISRIATQAAEGVAPGFWTRTRTHQRLVEANPVVTERREQRVGAMESLLKSIITAGITVVIGLMIIDELGYDITPLLASAGILGVALGFGAQSLVKDFLLGIFMILEDQYGVGDVIDLGEAIGTVEAVGLRVTRLRDVNGTVWYVRNGEVLRVGNMSQNWARSVLDIQVGYAENLDRVREALREIAHDMWVDETYKGDIIEEPEVWGVERLDPDAVIVRVVLKTKPMAQWEIAREMRERVKERFDEMGIEIPKPQRVIWHRDQPAPPAGEASAAP